MTRTRVFVSYSHADLEWLDRFKEHIAVLQRLNLVDIWSDDRINAGVDWEQEIENALSSARVAVLMISPAFLASEFIWTNEMPRIVAHAKQGMNILPLIIRPCAWRLAEELTRLQARPTAGRPLSRGSDSQIDEDLCSFTYELAAKVNRSPAAPTFSSDQSYVDDRSGASNLVPKEGEWIGYYNRDRAIRLLVRNIEGNSLHGALEYPNEGTVTKVEGTIHQTWRKDDPIWSQIAGAERVSDAVAISFRETGYELQGASSISFSGEYHAMIRGKAIKGAWFSGSRLVGLVDLERRMDSA